MIKGLIFLDGKFEYGKISWENDTISEVALLPKEDLADSEQENLIIPGLVDVHFHGCMGADICNCVGESAQADLNKIVEYEISSGITALCPATMTYDEARLSKVMRAISDFRRSDSDYSDAVCGIHLEGPFISKNKCGAQNTEYIQKPDTDMIDRLNELSQNMIKLVSIAPETEGAIDCIKVGKWRYHFSLAHTEADYDTAMAAMAAGADHVTHMFNAMPRFENRAPGVIGAAFDNKDVFAEIICDGVHNHESVIRAAFAMFSDERMVLISDSMEACGMPDGRYELGGLPVNVEGKRATLDSGTIAGSVTNLFDCMRTAISMGIQTESAIKAATINPARSIGADDKVGSFGVGKKADILVCDKQLNIKEIIWHGKSRGE